MNCQGIKVSSSTTAVRGYHRYSYDPCQNEACVERRVLKVSCSEFTIVPDTNTEGIIMGFCKIHDPQAKADREKARGDRRIKQYQEERALAARKRERDRLILKLTADLTNNQLIELTSFLESQDWKIPQGVK